MWKRRGIVRCGVKGSERGMEIEDEGLERGLHGCI